MGPGWSGREAGGATQESAEPWDPHLQPGASTSPPPKGTCVFLYLLSIRYPPHTHTHPPGGAVAHSPEKLLTQSCLNKGYFLHF